jgi:hypothetical protein
LSAVLLRLLGFDDAGFGLYYARGECSQRFGYSIALARLLNNFEMSTGVALTGYSLVSQIPAYNPQV